MSARRLSATIVVLAGFLTSAAMSGAVEHRLLPANTEIVVTINIKQILASDLVKSQAGLIKQAKALVDGSLPPGADEALKYLEKMGFDPDRDLTSVTIAHPGSMDPKDLFVIFEGSFDLAKIEATAKQVADKQGNALKITKIGKTTVYEIRPDGNTVVYAGLISNKAMVFTANEEAMKAAAGRAMAIMPVAMKVNNLLKNTNDKQSFSFVMTGTALVKMSDLAQKAKAGQKIPAEVKQVLQEIDGISSAVTIGKDVDVMVGVGFKKAADAMKYAQLGNILLPAGKDLLKTQIGAIPDLEALVDFVETLKVSQNGTNVTATGTFTNASLTKIFKSLGEKLK